MAGRDVIVLNEDAFQLEVPQGTDHYNFPDDVVMQKTLTVMGVNLGPVDNGTATSITATSISDTGKTWAVNQYPNYVVQYLSGGTIVNSVILSNTADKLTLPVTALAPDVGTTYSIIQNTALGDMNTAVYDPTTIAEQLVGLTATQTLTNKTLTSPSITTPTGIVGGDIVNTPAGNIAATDIQAAINELDTEKSATWHTHTTADVTDIPAPVTTNYIRGNAAGDAYETRTPAQVQSDINAEPANANIQAHISSSSNPHAVTAAQVGAIRLTDQNNFTARQTWQFGANIASASAITLGTDGNAFHITGSATISDFTHITGSGPFLLITDGTPTFTHATGVLETNTGADITAAAGDRFRLDQDSDGTTWLLTQLGASGAGGGLGVGQTWQDMTASRTTGVTYTNSTGKPIMCSVQNNWNTTITINGVAIGTVTVVNSFTPYTFIVPDGHTYLATGTKGPWFKWSELR